MPTIRSGIIVRIVVVATTKTDANTGLRFRHVVRALNYPSAIKHCPG